MSYVGKWFWSNAIGNSVIFGAALWGQPLVVGVVALGVIALGLAGILVSASMPRLLWSMAEKGEFTAVTKITKTLLEYRPAWWPWFDRSHDAVVLGALLWLMWPLAAAYATVIVATETQRHFRSHSKAAALAVWVWYYGDQAAEKLTKLLDKEYHHENT